MYSVSDPHAGTAPSVLSHMSILTAVSLYYLTDSFMSAEYIYAQNPGILKSVYQKATTDAPLLFSNFKYNVMYWPAQYLKKATGNLVYFKGSVLYLMYCEPWADGPAVNPRS